MSQDKGTMALTRPFVVYAPGKAEKQSGLLNASAALKITPIPVAFTLANTREEAAKLSDVPGAYAVPAEEADAADLARVTSIATVGLLAEVYKLLYGLTQIASAQAVTAAKRNLGIVQ